MERVKRVTVPAWIHARSRRPGLCMPGALRREPTRSTCPIGMELFRVPASCAARGKCVVRANTRTCFSGSRWPVRLGKKKGWDWLGV